VLEESVGLAQAQLPRFDREELSRVEAALSVKDGGGGGVIAGVQAQGSHRPPSGEKVSGAGAATWARG
jgi:hypothetical protein